MGSTHDKTTVAMSARSDPTTPASEDFPSSGPGNTIGPYRTIEMIGAGGFGEVWLAEQSQPIARRVALKLIRLGMDSRSMIARFDQERRALALMDHPSIAKVHDAGTTEAGRLYFVMEYVKGAPITEFCDRERLTVTQRLALFLKVCEAVQHAHMKGIIHRDLKPSNILVTVDDGAPDNSAARPVIIDFGIAKAAAAPLTDKTIHTMQGQLLGTPEYMSPEQAEMSEADIDTRTDVYALGVILYELLTGVLPFESATLRSQGHAAIQRMIREVDPPRPSVRLGSLGAAGTKIAESRRAAIGELTTSLRTELEWIPLKAMRKDRAERYRGASELADDIVNYLEHRPLIAGPESASYRLRKFVRRNRAAVLTGAAVFTALVLGLAGTFWQARVAAAERDAAQAAEREQGVLRAAAEVSEKHAREEAAEAQRQRSQAERSRMRSDLIAEFMSDMLKGAGPSVALARDIAMLKEMLDTAARRIERGDLKENPDAELDLRATIGRTYRDLAAFDDAGTMLEPAVTLARSLRPGDSQATADALGNLARLYQARGDMAQAEPVYREALEMYARLSLEDSRGGAACLNNLAQVLQARGDLAGAEPLFRRSLETLQRLFPGDDADVAVGLMSLAVLLQARGNLTESEPLLHESLEMKRRLYPGDHPYVASGLNNLAHVLRERGDLAGAEPLFRESLELARHLHQGDHPDVAAAANNLAMLLQDRGDLVGAEPLARESLEMRQRLYPGDNLDVATSLNNLAGLLWARADAAGAESAFREALDMMKRLFPGDHQVVAIGLNNLSYVLQSRGNLAAAEPILRESLEMMRRLFKGDHPDVATTLNNLALLLKARGDAAGAEATFREALEMMQRVYPGDHPDVALALDNVGFMLNAGGDAAGAEPFFRQSAEMFEHTLGRDHWSTGNSRLDLGRALTLLDRFAEAEPELIEAERVLAAAQGVPAGRHKQSVQALITLYESWDKADSGNGHDTQAAEWKEKLAPVPGP